MEENFEESLIPSNLFDDDDESSEEVEVVELENEDKIKENTGENTKTDSGGGIIADDGDNVTKIIDGEDNTATITTDGGDGCSSLPSSTSTGRFNVEENYAVIDSETAAKFERLYQQASLFNQQISRGLHGNWNLETGFIPPNTTRTEIAVSGHQVPTYVNAYNADYESNFVHVASPCPNTLSQETPLYSLPSIATHLPTHPIYPLAYQHYSHLSNATLPTYSHPISWPQPHELVPAFPWFPQPYFHGLQLPSQSVTRHFSPRIILPPPEPPAQLSQEIVSNNQPPIRQNWAPEGSSSFRPIYPFRSGVPESVVSVDPPTSTCQPDQDTLLSGSSSEILPKEPSGSSNLLAAVPASSSVASCNKEAASGSRSKKGRRRKKKPKKTC